MGVHSEPRSFLTTFPGAPHQRRTLWHRDQLKVTLKAVWCVPLIIRRWQLVALRMDSASCEAVAAATPAATFGDVSLRCLGFERATECWPLETGGFACAEAPVGLGQHRGPGFKSPVCMPREAGRVALERVAYGARFDI